MKAIFGIPKVTYSAPSESQEQKCLFVEIEDSRNTFKDARAIAKVSGTITLFGENEQIPFGFFSKCIAQHPTLTKDLFFYDFEQNTRTYANLVQRRCSFVYFFDGQYDPAIGTINAVILTQESEP